MLNATSSTEPTRQMMRHFSVVGFIALAYPLDQLSSFPVDDTSTLGFDGGEPNLDLFDEGWSTVASQEPEPVLNLPSNLFDEAQPDPTSDLSDNLSKSYPSEETAADIIATAANCPSTLTPANRIRSSEDGGQCVGSQPSEITFDDMMNEQIKRQWCSRIPWVNFGNIPVARMTDSYIFPVQPEAIPDVPSSIIPLPGYFNVMKAALRKSIRPALSLQ